MRDSANAKKKQTQTKSYPICLRQKQTNKNLGMTYLLPVFKPSASSAETQIKESNKENKTKQS